MPYQKYQGPPIVVRYVSKVSMKTWIQTRKFEKQYYWALGITFVENSSNYRLLQKKQLLKIIGLLIF